MSIFNNGRNGTFSDSELRAVEHSVLGGRRVLWAGVLAVLLPLAKPPLRPLPRMSARAYPPLVAIAVELSRVLPRPLAVEMAVPPLEKLEAVTCAWASDATKENAARANAVSKVRVIIVGFLRDSAGLVFEEGDVAFTRTCERSTGNP